MPTLNDDATVYGKLYEAKAVLRALETQLKIAYREIDRQERLIAALHDGLDDHWKEQPENAGVVHVAKLTKDKVAAHD